MKTQLLASLLLASIAATMLFTPAFAQPQIVQTSCDTLSLEPLRVRIEFAILNQADFGICHMGMAVMNTPTDTCLVRDCQSPSGWSCRILPDGEIVHWEVVPDTEGQVDCIEPGESLAGFGFVTDTPLCCYITGFDTGVVPEPSYEGTMCFDCPAPVQALSGTWGELKAIYR